MDPTEPSVCREAAARCRKAALSSTDPKEWILMAEQWDWLADTADGSCAMPSTLAGFEALKPQAHTRSR